jgi:hypothetical protein
VLDYEDDLAFQLADRPDLVDLLSDGALASYTRTTLGQTARSGVNPLASAGDLITDAAGLAEHSKAIGEHDPNFAYGQSGREVSARDTGLPDRIVRFSLEHTGEMPRYSLTLRDGDTVTDIEANPRPDVLFVGPEPWFAPDAGGDESRARARASLAKGVPIELSGEEVGLRPGTVPDRFRAWLDDAGLMRNGTLTLSISEPAELTVTLTDNGSVALEKVALHRVPAESGGTLAYAGHLGGTIISLDVRHGDDRRDTSGQAFDAELTVGITLAVGGEPAGEALHGLGFARAFARAEQVDLHCPGVLPAEGVGWTDADGASEADEETWELVMVLAGALDALNRRDQGERKMSNAVSEQDRNTAEVVLELLAGRDVKIAAAEGEFEMALPPTVGVGSDPKSLLRIEGNLGNIGSEPTRLAVIQELRNITPLEVIRRTGGRPMLRCRNDGDGHSLLRLAA